jgi:diadenosine tetraphosphate (Ap4A) HIT family hydrolase
MGCGTRTYMNRLGSGTAVGANVRQHLKECHQRRALVNMLVVAPVTHVHFHFHPRSKALERQVKRCENTVSINSMHLPLNGRKVQTA